jgi:hypothetical protein
MSKIRQVKRKKKSVSLLSEQRVVSTFYTEEMKFTKYRSINNKSS